MMIERRKLIIVARYSIPSWYYLKINYFATAYYFDIEVLVRLVPYYIIIKIQRVFVVTDLMSKLII